MNLATLIDNNHHRFVPMFDPALNLKNTIHVDLSSGNHEFDGLTESEFDLAIVDKIEQTGAVAAVGGYLENRLWYKDTESFQGQEDRTVHLGVDVFMPPGTAIYAPLEGEVCSFGNRPGFGDYGPVIILRHILDGIEFHSLYGHLTEASLDGLSEGKVFAAGDKVAEMGIRPTNGNWPPHLHFQIIGDLQGLGHDYPGVARTEDLEFYKQNCPDPNSIILG